MPERDNGSVLLMVLIFFFVFVVIATSWARFAATQSHILVDREQEEQAFHIGEAGVHQVLALLNADICNPLNTLAQLDAIEPIVQQVIDPTSGAVVGTYEMVFSPETMLPDGEISFVLTVLGHDINKRLRCQEVEVEIRSSHDLLGVTYYIYAWNHRLDVTCTAPLAPTIISC